MGSYGHAQMTGFLCRLCSEHKKKVIHMYTDKGRKLKLIEKLKVLPVSVEPYDNLPKTFCEECIFRLNQQCKLVKRIQKGHIRDHHKTTHNGGECPEDCPFYKICLMAQIALEGAESSDED